MDVNQLGGNLAQGLVNKLSQQQTTVGPLAKWNFTVKDNIDVAGVDTHAGHPTLNNWRGTPSATASVIKSLLTGGAKLVGKAHMHEIGYGITGLNPHFGTPVNPVNDEWIPGGSSSGSAVSVAAGVAEFSVGTDTAGSIRVPAACCSIWGFRPSHGAFTDDGMVALAPSFDSVGIMARSGDVLEAVVRHLLRIEPEEVSVLPRVAYLPSDAIALTDTATANASLLVLRHLERVGIGAQEINFDLLEDIRETLRILQASEAWQTHREWVEQSSPNLGQDVSQLLGVASAIRSEEVAEARRSRERLVAEVEEVLRDGAVFVMPILPTRPLTIADADEPEKAAKFRIGTMRLVTLASLASLPSLAVPIRVRGVQEAAIGVQIVAGRGREAMLLEVARRLRELERRPYMKRRDVSSKSW